MAMVTENEVVNLYGIVSDDTNDVDGTQTPDIIEDDIIKPIQNNLDNLIIFPHFLYRSYLPLKKIEQLNLLNL